ncbi:cohesin subunit SA-2-like [Corticium candelabrum]|uniref:cohesin subunit SA-2-like n=1 Tax=Corticium candelabrum TaxID=121492 RepID=UPI002E2743AF|nr:cohesin subunit SA-2-like [Corticium candelabrum]
MPRKRAKGPTARQGSSPGTRAATRLMTRANQSSEELVDDAPVDESLSEEKIESMNESVVEESVEETPTKDLNRSLKKRKTTPKKRKKSIVIPIIGDKSLFDIVKEGSASLSAVVNGWIDSYESSRDLAATDLIQFIVHCSGCQGEVTIDMLHSDMTECIMMLTEKFSGGIYPLLSHSTAYRGLKGNVFEFVERMVADCHQRGLLYDGWLIPIVIMPWMTTLSASQVRPFRHAATLIAMKMTTELAKVLTAIEEELNKSELQLGTESRKSKGRRGSRKVETLEDTMEELNEHSEEVKGMIQQLITSVFNHRYRDVRPEIRTLCMAEIGHWMDKNRVLFVRDEYLRYLGWCLHDTSADVRLCVMQSLILVYSNSENSDNLKLFTSRFKERIVSMTTDKDDNVAQQAILLVEKMLEYEQVSAEDVESVYQLVFGVSRVVSHAAGQFLAHQLLSEEQLQAKGEELGNDVRDSELHLIQLLEYFTEAGLHHHTEFYVDSLWSHCPVLREWETMTDMLLSEERTLTEEQERVLIDMMASCATRAAGKPPPMQRQPHKKFVSTKDRKQNEEDCRRMSSLMTAVLPELMSKFGTTSENVVNLISIVKCLDLTRYSELRCMNDLESLLNELSSLVEKGTDDKLLYECAEAYQYLLSSGSAVKRASETALSTLQDTLVANFKDAVLNAAHGPDDTLALNDEKTSFTVLCAVRRLTAFLRVFDMTRFDLFDEMNAIVAGYCEDSESVNSEMVVPACTALFGVLMREAQNVKDGFTKGKKALSHLKHQIELLGSHFDTVLQTVDDAEIQRQVLVLFAEFMIGFGQHLRMKGLSSLVFISSESTQHRFLSLACRHIFYEEEDVDKQDDEDELRDSELLNAKRRVLAAIIKLVIYQVVDMKFATPIFAECLNYKSGLSDLIKMFMNKCRDLDKQYYAEALLVTLQQRFELLMDNSSGNIDTLSDLWKEVKELAHHFALTFGTDLMKIREPMVKLQRKGIEYSLSKELGHSQRYASDDSFAAPPNLLFFDLLTKFTFKLMKIDKAGRKGLLGYLDQRLSLEMQDHMDDTEFRPLKEYRMNLIAAQQRDPENDIPKKQTRNARGRGRRKQASDAQPEKEKQDNEQQRVQDGETPNGWLHRREAASAKKKKPVAKQSRESKKRVNRRSEDNSKMAKRRKASARLHNGVNETSVEMDSSLFEKSSQHTVGDKLNRSHSSLDTPTRGRRVRQRHESGETSESDLDLIESDVATPIKEISPRKRVRRSYKPLPDIFDEGQSEEVSDEELAKAFDD